MPAAAGRICAACLFSGSNFFLGAALADDADDHRIVFAVLDQAHALGQLQLRSVDVFTQLERAEVDLDEFRQVLGRQATSTSVVT